MNEGKKMYDNFIQNINDFKELSPLEFLLKYDYIEENEIIKEYDLYCNDNKLEELLTYEEWKEEYNREMKDELNDKIISNFEAIEIDVYKNKYNEYIYIVTIALGGPTIRIEFRSIYKSVIYKYYLGGDEYNKDISYLYEDLFYLFNLDIYE